MMAAGSMTPLTLDWLNANAAAVSALAALATALVAVIALASTALDSRSRTRPFVAAELLPARHSTSSVILRVTNYGPTIARNLRLEFEPQLDPLPSRDAALSTQKRYAGVVPHLGPGQSLSNVWQTWAAKGKVHSSPDLCTVTITYASGRRQFVDRFTLDLETVALETIVVSSDSELGSLRKIAAAAESLSLTAKQAL
jgi:hypothetical protein